MFEKFTGAARAAVVQAHGEAKELSAPRIGTPHVLLGVLAVESDSTLGAVCGESGLTATTVRERLAGGAEERPLGDADAEALRSVGIDLDAVRESVEATFGVNALDGVDTPAERRGWFARRGGHIPFTPAAKKALELALREALARKDTGIGAEHILLGLLRGADPEVLAAIGPRVDRVELRRRVLELLDRAA